MKEMKGMINSDVIKPKILYYGTPVILLNTLNEDDTVNISPISSSWALGDYIILGIGLGGKAIENLEGIRNVSSTFLILPYGKMLNN